MEKDTLEKLKQLASWLEEIKSNVQQVETELIQMIKQEEMKEKLLHPEYELMD